MSEIPATIEAQINITFVGRRSKWLGQRGSHHWEERCVLLYRDSASPSQAMMAMEAAKMTAERKRRMRERRVHVER